MKLRVVEAFAGVGSQRMALRNLGIEHEVVGIFEIDKYALSSYEAIHGECPNLGDISKIEIEGVPEHDLFTYSFPCQDISIAGKQASLEEGSGTRSSLLWECKRIIEGKKPKFLLLENVKNLVGKKHRPYFEKWLNYLESQGYNNYWEVLNAKDYGVPQNRERVFVVSILKEYDTGFRFESGFDSGIRLRHILEDSVDEKYYINTERASVLIDKLMEAGYLKGNITPCDSTIMKPKSLEVANCITARYDAGIQNKQSIGVAVVEKTIVGVIGSTQKNDYVGNGELCSTLTSAMGQGGGHIPMVASRLGGLFDDEKGKHQAGSVWNSNGICPTLDTMQGGYRQPCILDKGANIEVVGRLEHEGWYDIEKRVYSTEGISPTIEPHNRGKYLDKYRVRKLTPKECWRLMGFLDEDFERASKVCSNTQLYKQAGNSIVVKVLESIFRSMFLKEKVEEFVEKEEEYEQISFL